MFSFFKKISSYNFPKVLLTSQYTKDAVMREIEFLEARLEALQQIQREKKIHNV